MPKSCKNCNLPITSGRSDKLYCGVNCKNEFNNKEYASYNVFFARTEKHLRRQFMKLYPKFKGSNKQIVLDSVELKKIGFNPKLCTQISPKGNPILYNIQFIKLNHRDQYEFTILQQQLQSRNDGVCTRGQKHLSYWIINTGSGRCISYYHLHSRKEAYSERVGFCFISPFQSPRTYTFLLWQDLYSHTSTYSTKVELVTKDNGVHSLIGDLLS